MSKEKPSKSNYPVNMTETPFPMRGDLAKREPQFTKQPTAWLTKGCWADEIQTGGTNGNGNHNASRRSASADFFAGIASVAADIAGDGEPSRDADPEIPRGRVNIEH